MAPHCTRSGPTAAAAAAGPIRAADIAELCAAHCHIREPERVGQLLTAIVADGADQLQVVSDFDYTITKQYKRDGSRMPSSFCVLNMCASLPDTCRAESLKLVQRFRPIELDPHLPVATKTAAMVEWWRLSSAIHRGFRLDRGEIVAAARTFNDDCLREGTAELFERLHALGVPVLVFSAGLGDSVHAILEETHVMYGNVQVLGNYLRFGEDDMLEGFDEEHVIHPFNKNEHALEGTALFGRVHDRRNVLVMGDSLGDAEMASGSATEGNVLKIGFLWEHVEANLPLYMERFDIVLVDDQTMNVPRAILARIGDVTPVADAAETAELPQRTDA